LFSFFFLLIEKHSLKKQKIVLNITALAMALSYLQSISVVVGFLGFFAW
jgi:hypothetical protein